MKLTYIAAALLTATSVQADSIELLAGKYAVSDAKFFRKITEDTRLLYRNRISYEDMNAFTLVQLNHKLSNSWKGFVEGVFGKEANPRFGFMYAKQGLCSTGQSCAVQYRTVQYSALLL